VQGDGNCPFENVALFVENEVKATENIVMYAIINWKERNL
jgi:hypothetical protein